MRVMIIGASNHKRKFGNMAVRAYLRKGHEVVPVNPHESEVEGLHCVSSALEAPGKFDRTLFYVPPPTGLEVIEDLARHGHAGEIWLNPGAESPALIERSRQLGFEPILDCAIVDIGERP